MDDLSPSKKNEAEDTFYKSMPNLGSSNQLQAYYQIGRGSSDGYIIPINKEDCIPEGDVREGQMQTLLSPSSFPQHQTQALCQTLIQKWAMSRGAASYSGPSEQRIIGLWSRQLKNPVSRMEVNH
ncbi:hypothetical protein WMY93_024999 [Mugilogobius chulae]|uniref:GPCR family 2 latrophilin C-terminal domain-containing protein n=1 Tax=Mugilogobius chulae TaxID=88201 RepID=A0AAW0ND70_9GOBI